MAQFAHLTTLNTNDIFRGATMEAEFDNYDTQINLMLQYNGAAVATITALQALVNAANYVAGSPDQPILDGQIKVVKVVSDGTNNTRGIYQYVSGDATSDADAAGVDTDGIVAPSTSGMGRWFRVGSSGDIHKRGVVGLRTMFNALNIDLNTDSVAADAFLVLTKRSAGSQVKILTNEQVAIRNAADSAYEDFAALGGTFAGAVSGTTGTFSAAVSGTTGTFSGAVAGTTGTFSAAVAGTTGTFSGAVSGTTGTFSGAVSGTTGSFSGEVTVATAVAGTSAPTLTQMTNAIGSGVGYTFSPIHIDSLTLWLSADQQTGYADAAVVSPWTDISGRAQACSEATNKPTYRTNVINGKATVRFDGTNDKLNSAAALSTFATVAVYTAFAVIKTPGAFAAGASVCGIANSVGLLGAENASNCRFGLLLDSTGNLRALNYDSGGQDSIAYGSALSVATSYLVTWRHSGGNLYIQVNNGAEASVASIDTDNLDAVLTLGYLDSAGTDYFGACDIAEMIMYDAALDATDILRVKNYLNTKYALY